MKYYLKEEFLHDNNVKNAGNKARNDVEEIVKREGYQALVLSVDNWYEMSTLKAQLHKSKAFDQALNELKQGDELLIQFPMLHHSFFTTAARQLIVHRKGRSSPLTKRKKGYGPVCFDFYVKAMLRQEIDQFIYPLL